MLSDSPKLIRMTPVRPMHDGGGGHSQLALRQLGTANLPNLQKFSQLFRSDTHLPRWSHSCPTPEESSEGSRSPAFLRRRSWEEPNRSWARSHSRSRTH